MTYAVIGGDARMRYLAQELAREYTVLDCADKLYDLWDSECIVLPVPAEKNGVLFAPDRKENIRMAELISRLPEGALVIGGKLSADTVSLAEVRGLRVIDLMHDATFTVGNAALTAEGAVQLLMGALPVSLDGASVLVIGFGRIGALLCRKLAALGACVTVLSQNAEKRAMARALGYETALNGEFDAAVNTAPAKVLQGLEELGRDCVLLELASSPGFDGAEAKRLGQRLIAAPGLPGVYAPKSAGELIGVVVRNIVKEQGL